jgi:spore maturation protein CgeB
MKALYIGILSEGTTSRMRADTLQRLTPDFRWSVIDTDESFHHAPRVWKTTAFRFKLGPLVRQINRKIVARTEQQQYDLVWVDKGVYLWPETVEYLRKRAGRLVHYTPDTAFYANRSRHFFASADKYDLLITTKSFELEYYAGIADSERVYLTTQAYDANLHRPPTTLPEKKAAAVFIGLWEQDRQECIEALLRSGVPVRLGGRGWDKFVSSHSSNPALCFLGREVFGEDYVSEYASAMIGLGLLSKRFPELHTTRTFEIPATGTLLATERTEEIMRFFKDGEVLFFDDYQCLAARVEKLLKAPDKVSAIAKKGHERVIYGGYDYASVLSTILRRLSLLP